MQLHNKANTSPDALLNKPTDSPVVNPNLDSPYEQENSRDFLPKQEAVVPFIPESIPDAPAKKQPLFSARAVVILLSVLGIGGGLLALPSLTNCTNKAIQAEAKQNIGVLNRAQQAYYLEFQTFTNSLTDLGVGINPQSVNYNYSIRATKTSTIHYAIARNKTKKSYVGAVFLVPATKIDRKVDNKEIRTVAFACEALRPGHTIPTAPTLEKGCGSDTKDLGIYQKYQD
jgi:type II secretory pathway pseudopilin PulG